MHRLKAHIVDLGVGEVISRGRNADVDLARQVGELWIATPVVGDHVLDFLCVLWIGEVCSQSAHVVSQGGRLVRKSRL